MKELINEIKKINERLDTLYATRTCPGKQKCRGYL